MIGESIYAVRDQVLDRWVTKYGTSNYVYVRKCDASAVCNRLNKTWQKNRTPHDREERYILLENTKPAWHDA